jgi:condensin complex subunit 1
MNGNNVLPQAFRDAFACHLYMLYTIMFFNESEAKAQKSLANTGPAAPGRKKKISTKEKEKKAQAECFQNSRESCARAMLTAVKAMWENKSTLWKRGVPDENVVSLPCRISYQMLETATGVIARKLSSGDVALQIIALTVDQADSLLGTIVAALVDLLHSFEHIAPLAAELCCMVSHEPTNKLALELFREIGHLNVSGSSASDATGKASGIRYIAPFIHELAALQPKFVLKHISLVLPHLQTESYNLRSSIVAAIGHVLIKCTDQDSDDNENEIYNEQEGEESLNTKNNMSEKRENMFDILTERSHDTSSFTRGMVLKTWATLIEKHSLPIKRLIPVTALAIDRLQDKTVNVRRSAMQVRCHLKQSATFQNHRMCSHDLTIL